MRVKVKQQRSFRLPKTSFLGFRIGFLIALFLLPAIYTYYGFQPYRVDASAPERLFIPSINLSTPVDNVSKNGFSLEVPEIIAGAYSENTNKTLLIGHSNTVFEHLNRLNPGDTLIFDEQTYQIRNITTKAKSEIDMSQILSAAEQPTIILMTCTGQHLSGHDYSHRLIITATLSVI